MPKTTFRILTAALAVTAMTVVGVGSAQADPPVQSGFPVNLSGDFIRHGSIALGDLTGDGVPEIVVGGSDGMLYAYRGNGTLLWEVNTGNMGIDGKAAIGDVDGDMQPEVVIGAGSTSTPSAHGRLMIFNHLGGLQCDVDTIDITGDGFREGVYSSPAIGDLDGNDGGKLEIVFGAWDHFVRAVHHDCSVYWTKQTFDTVWSSPTIFDIDRDGALEVIIGGDSFIIEGGRLYVVNGQTGADQAGFPIQIDEVIFSSPAIGDVDGDGWADIIVGTGNCWGADTACGDLTPAEVGEYVNAWDRNGNTLPGWPVAIPGRIVESSPALADLDNDGDLEIIAGVLERDTGNPAEGWVYAWNGNGTLVSGNWPVQPSTPSGCAGASVQRATPASVIVADVTGNSDLEVLLPAGGDVVIYDRLGNQLTRTALEPGAGGCVPTDPNDLELDSAWTINSTPAVGDIDGDGDLEVVAGSYQNFNQTPGALYAWDFPKLEANAETPWPVFQGFQDNNSFIAPDLLIFTDGFESGLLTLWSAEVP